MGRLNHDITRSNLRRMERAPWPPYHFGQR